MKKNVLFLTAMFAVSIFALVAGTSFLLSDRLCAANTSENDVKELLADKRTENMSPFTGIVNNVVADVKIVIDKNVKFRVDIQDSKDYRIYLSVRDSRLYIDGDRRRTGDFNSTDCKVTVYVSEISQLINNGVGDMKVDGSLVTESLVIKNNGVGGVNIPSLKTTKAELNLNGVGDIKIDDLTTVKADLRLNGVGDIKVQNLKCENLNARLNGAGDIVIKGEGDNAAYGLQGTGTLNATAMKVKSAEAYSNSNSGELKFYAKLNYKIGGTCREVVKGTGPAFK